MHGVLVAVDGIPSSDIRDRASKALLPLARATDDAKSKVVGAGGVDKFLNYVHDARMQSFSLEMLQLLATSGQTVRTAFADKFVRGVGIPSVLKILHSSSDEHVSNKFSLIADRRDQQRG